MSAVLWGLIIGSFATVAVERWPAIIEGRMAASALWFPGSRCPPCGRPLGPVQRLPLVGWLVLKGRCRCGKAPIPLRYPLLEIGGGLVMGAMVAMAPGPLDHTLLMSVVAAFLYLAAVVDARSGYLPDALTLGLLWLGLLAAAFAPCGVLAIGAAEAVLGAGVGFLLMAAVAGAGRLVLGREALARGDWKLVAAIGAWGGIEAVTLAILFGALAALALSPWLRRFHVAEADVGHAAGIPLGPGLALAALPIIVLGLTPGQMFN
ncbi:prepilin peptidase [Oleomonas cavernae]|uniref:prepilin peptidase n=1 Tax=Oleomonas cavernae TaxID=2320859 RepID=UPI0013144C46|nr:A24 family peptidase [Oleomonas cavernae]